MNIKLTIDKINEQINFLENQRTDLQSNCGHKSQITGNYSWRPGAYLPALICADCGKMIEYI